MIEGSVAVEGWTITEFDYHKLNISHRSSEKVTDTLYDYIDLINALYYS